MMAYSRGARMKTNPYDRMIQRLEAKLDNKAHEIALSQAPRLEKLLLAIGEYRQIKAEIDYWKSLQQKNERQMSAGLEEMDDEEDAAAPPRQLPPARRRPARGWGER